jgi:hypothetical protein
MRRGWLFAKPFRPVNGLAGSDCLSRKVLKAGVLPGHRGLADQAPLSIWSSKLGLRYCRMTRGQETEFPFIHPTTAFRSGGLKPSAETASTIPCRSSSNIATSVTFIRRVGLATLSVVARFPVRWGINKTADELFVLKRVARDWVSSW